MKPTIIGFGHRKRSGKDTAGQYLVDNFGFKKLSFADPLKQAAMLICSFSHEQCYGSDAEKEAVDPFWGFSPRTFMQLFGTEVGRAIDKNLWVKALQREAQKHERVVVCDVRFPNEAEAIRSMGGIVVRIDRPSLGEVKDTHASEISMNDFEYDLVIANDGTLKDLEHKIDTFMARAGLRTTSEHQDLLRMKAAILTLGEVAEPGFVEDRDDYTAVPIDRLSELLKLAGGK